MRSTLWAPSIVVVALLAGTAPAASQTVRESSPAAVLTSEEMEQFLLNAKVLDRLPDDGLK